MELVIILTFASMIFGYGYNETTETLDSPNWWV
jgi:hypothetical protein